jgi:hypothetical protein
MSKRRITAPCGLCQQRRLLCDSHLIPAAALSLLLSPNLRNPNPIHVGDAHHFTTSKPLKNYLLCEDCERRFSAHGEDWVLGHSLRQDGEFKIREALLSTTPFTAFHDGLAIYRGASIREVDLDQLVYFALSIFWRAAAIEWKREARIVKIELGPYLEPLRLFLLNRGPFPDSMALVVRVTSDRQPIPIVNEPESRNHSGFRLHAFSVPGLTFFLLVGARLPNGLLGHCTAPCSDGFIGLGTGIDADDFLRLGSRLSKARSRGFHV